MVEKAIVNTLQSYLTELASQNIPVEFGVLFGSQVRNSANENSDIDIVIVSSLFDRNKSLDKRLQLWRVAAKMDSRIEPIACGLHQWNEDTVNTIIEIARREGQIIYPAIVGQAVV